MRSTRRNAVQGRTPFVPHDLPRSNGNRVLIRNVPCPDCMAFIGDPCITVTGKEKRNTHRSRRRIAIREGHYTPTKNKERSS